MDLLLGRKALGVLAACQNNSVKKFSWKSLIKLKIKKPYRKPTQVGGHKCAKVKGRNLVKELGKLAVVSSK